MVLTRSDYPYSPCLPALPCVVQAELLLSRLRQAEQERAEAHKAAAASQAAEHKVGEGLEGQGL